jgi:hypothetical protein
LTPTQFNSRQAKHDGVAMVSDLFEQLTFTEVPPLPAEFDRDVHQRLNRRLLAVHFVELGLRGLPIALMHFAKALVGLMVLTLSGRYPAGPDDRPASAP